MIRFSLKCAEGHGFDSWFQSGAACDGLIARDLVACPECGSHAVSKALMAPAVAATKAEDTPAPAAAVSDPRLEALRAHVESNSDYVGTGFASEARAMYLGEVPERPIYGEARPDEARALLQDGVPVLPLPFVPSRKAH